MARIFTALTSPADSSSAFLREAGAGAKTFMDAQRQQEADEREQERYEVKEQRAVESHELNMESARIGVAAQNLAMEGVQQQQLEKEIGDQAAVERADTMLRDSGRLAADLPSGMMEEGQRLREGYDLAVASGDEKQIRAYQGALNRWADESDTAYKAAGDASMSRSYLSSIEQYMGLLGEDNITWAQQEQIAGMNRGELEQLHKELQRTFLERQEIQRSTEEMTAWVDGIDLTKITEEQGQAVQRFRNLITSPMPVRINQDTAAEVVAWHRQESGKLQVELLPTAGEEIVDGMNAELVQTRNELTALNEQMQTMLADMPNYGAMIQPGMLTQQGMLTPQQLGDIRSTALGTGGGTGLDEFGGLGPPIATEEGEGALDPETLVDGEGGVKEGGVSRRTEAARALNDPSGPYGHPDIGARNPLYGPWGAGRPHLKERPDDRTEETLDALNAAGPEVVSAFEAGAELYDNLPRHLFRGKGVGHISMNHNKALKVLGSGDASRNEKADAVVSLQQWAVSLAQVDVEEGGPVSAWAEKVLGGTDMISGGEAGGEASDRKSWPTGKLSRRPGSRFQGGRETWEPPVEGPATGTPSPGAGPGSPRSARVDATAAQARPEVVLPPEHPAHGQGAGVPPAVDEGTEVLMAGGEMLESVRAMVANPPELDTKGLHPVKRNRLLKAQRAFLKRLGALEALLARAVEEQDAKRVESLMGQVEKLVEKVNRGSQD